MAIIDGYTANRAEAEAKRGHPIDARLFKLNTQGHRMIVLRDSVSQQRASGIYIPPAAAERIQDGMGRGIILAVGPLCGSPGAPHPVGISCGDPRDLLLAAVIFFQWAGKTLKSGDIDSEFGGDVVVLTDRDVQCIDMWEEE